VGFESSEVARRRLAVLARSNQRVQDALVPTIAAEGWTSSAWSPAPDDATALEATWTATPGPGADVATEPLPTPATADTALASTLELLALDIVETPGAGGALLAAFAQQARALQLVAEAARRNPHAPLPPCVLEAVHATLQPARPSP
jgi:hypothetical protein